MGVLVIVAGRHVLHRCAFAGFFLAHVHAWHGFGLRRGGRLLSGGTLRNWGVVAGHRNQQYRDDKNGAKNHSGFRGEMKQRSTR
jgi:hypothetical protein